MVKSGFFLVLVTFLLVGLAFAVDSPDLSAAPAPGPAADSFGSDAPAPDTGSPSNAPENSPMLSPPAPVGMAPTPNAAPAPAPSLKSPPESPAAPTPAPVPGEAADVSHSDVTANGDEGDSSGGGMSGGKKAGIAVGVIAAACVVGFGGLVYKKRQDNIRRSQYGYAARRELL